MLGPLTVQESCLNPFLGSKSYLLHRNLGQRRLNTLELIPGKRHSDRGGEVLSYGGLGECPTDLPKSSDWMTLPDRTRDLDLVSG